MLPERLLDVAVRENELHPRYLTSRDRLWIEPLLDALVACAGRARREVVARLEAASDRGAPWRARRALVHLLLAGSGFRIDAPLDPTTIRAVVFEEAAGGDRPGALARAAGRLGVPSEVLVRALYADLPAARVLEPSRVPASLPEFIERYNLALAQGILLRAETLRIRVVENLKAVLRHARLQRLLCGMETDPGDARATRLELSGPLSLFRFTTKYGRAMAAWLPVLLQTPCWSLEAGCVVGGARATWRASWRDPIGTTHAPLRRFDSHVEERLFRDVARLAPEWEVLREADPVQIGSRIVAPDFTLRHRRRGVRVPVEVVGYWTPDYLRRKLDTLRALPDGARWIVCVDTGLGVSAEDLPALDVLPFSRRVDAARLLEAAARRLVPQDSCGAPRFLNTRPP